MSAPECQSCAMPMTSEELVGTEADGSRNQENCIYCYENGRYKEPNLTVEQMVEACVPFLVQEGVAEADARPAIPVVTYQGTGGGIDLAEGYRIDKSLLTRDELASLFTALKAATAYRDRRAEGRQLRLLQRPGGVHRPGGGALRTGAPWEADWDRVAKRVDLLLRFQPSARGCGDRLLRGRAD